MSPATRCYSISFFVLALIRRVSIAGFLLFATVVPVLAQEGFDVDEVHFRGNEILSDDELAERMTLRGANFFQQLFRTRERTQFYRETLNSDLEKLVRYCQRQGLLDARATVEDLQVNNKDRKVSIVIRIDEGPPILLRAIDYDLKAGPNVRTDSLEIVISILKRNMSIRSGDRFRDDAIQNERAAMARRLYDRGFPYARATPNLKVDTSAKRVDITWELETGPHCVFGDVSITGNTRVGEKYIRGQLSFKKGDQYQARALDRAQQQIYGLGTFEIVTVNAQLPTTPDTSIDVTVRVSEAPTLSTRFGVGYGREDNFRVFSDSRVLSFLGGIRRLDIYAKHSGLEPYRVEVRLTRPAFLTPRTTGILAPFIREQDEPGFTVKRVGGNASIQHQFSNKLNATGTYTFERITLDTSSVSEAEVSDADFDELYNRSSILTGLTLDNSRPLFSPTQGYFAALTFKLSGVVFKSDFKYTKTTLDLRRYTRWQGMVLAAKAEMGGIAATTERDFIPVEDRLFSGGGSSVRGWARSELGPLDDKGLPVGGNSLMEISVELRYPIIGRFSGVLFSDVGNVWRGFYTYHLDDLRYSAGFGFRFEFPIGPARVDFARPIDDNTAKWQFHLSIGQAF